VAERAVVAVSPRVDLALGTEREAVPEPSDDAHDECALQRRHWGGRANLPRAAGVNHGVPQASDAAASEQTAVLIKSVLIPPRAGACRI